MQLVDYASALAAAQRLVPDYRDLRQQDAQTRVLEAQPQLIQAQIARSQAQSQQEAQDAAYKEQRHTAFQTKLQGLGARPDAKGLYEISAEFPEFATALQGAAKGINTEDGTKLVRNLAPITKLIQNGRYTDAADDLDRHIKADKDAGIEPDEHDTEMLGMLRSGDPKQAQLAGGIAFSLITALNPDTAAKNLADAGQIGARKGQVVGRTIGHYDDDGQWVSDYRDPDPEANALDVGVYDDQGHRVGTQLIPNGGRGGAAGGAAPSTAGRTTGGWTPRARNGGDNTDAAVDGKITGMSRALGIDPSAPFPPGTTNMQIAQALTLSEGGKGSIADRNNNPGNLTDPKTGGYRKFATKEAGLAAAAQQVARNRSRGQNTIRSMVEGLPAGRGSVPAGGTNGGYIGPVPSASTSANSGDPTLTGDAYLASVPAYERAKIKAIAEGRVAAPRPGTRFGEAILTKVAQYDPTFDAANSQSRLKTRTDFTSGKSAQAVNALNTAMGHLLHLDTQAKGLGNFSTLPGLLNPAYNAARRVAGDTKLPAFQQTKQAASSEMRKVFAGSAGGNLTELKEWQESLDSSQSYEQLHAAIKNGVELMGSRLTALQDQYQTGMGRSDQPMQLIKPGVRAATRKRFGIDLGGGGSSGAPAAHSQPAPAAPSRFRILKVRPK